MLRQLSRSGDFNALGENGVDVEGIRDVLQLVGAQSNGCQLRVVLYLFGDLPGDQDPTRDGQVFDSCSNVDSIAVGSLLVIGDITHVKADTNRELRGGLELTLDLD